MSLHIIVCVILFPINSHTIHTRVQFLKWKLDNEYIYIYTILCCLSCCYRYVIDWVPYPPFPFLFSLISSSILHPLPFFPVILSLSFLSSFSYHYYFTLPLLFTFHLCLTPPLHISPLPSPFKALSLYFVPVITNQYINIFACVCVTYKCMYFDMELETIYIYIYILYVGMYVYIYCM
jgi:hypothetical protein